MLLAAMLLVEHGCNVENSRSALKSAVALVLDAVLKEYTRRDLSARLEIHNHASYFRKDRVLN